MNLFERILNTTFYSYKKCENENKPEEKPKKYICHNCGDKLASYKLYREHMMNPIPCWDEEE